jgi:sensor histidine kinase YesM
METTTTYGQPYMRASQADYPLVRQMLSKRIAYHLLFWVVIFVYNTLYLGFLWNDYTSSFYEFAIILPFYIGIVYFNVYYLIPRYLAKQNYPVYFALLLLAMVLTVVSFQILTNQLVISNFCPTSYKRFPLFDTRKTLKEAFHTTSLMALVTGIKLTKDWVSQQQKIQTIEKQNVKNELEFLKSQIQPHFFFNTLNNLYSLSVRKSDLAPEVVLKLSDLMSYMLYESDNQETTLKKEIDHIQNYLALESLRFGQRLRLDFQIDGNTDHKRVPPLLLLPFIENAFKHGTSHETGELDIRILLKTTPQHLIFEVSNPRFEQKNNRKKHKGLGLKNVKRRLDLLYAKNHVLNIQETDNQYSISLKIPI